MSKFTAEDVVKQFSSKASVKVYSKEASKGLWKSEERLIKKYFKEKGKTLDIGCGTGRTTKPLHDMGFDVIGLDITPAFIEIAKKSHKGVKFVVGDATKLKYKDGYFDNALFSFNGWCQIPGKKNRKRALEEVYRVLRPGGVYIFSSHWRRWGRPYTYRWFKRWIRFYVLRHLGLKLKEQEFGDIFFKRDSTTSFDTDQFIHIPKLGQVKKLISDVGFELVFSDDRDSIASEDPELFGLNDMFYVCKKP